MQTILPRHKSILKWLILGSCIALLSSGCDNQQSNSVKNISEIEESANAKVKFGMLPYADHTYAIIGVEQGWFKDVNIDLEYRNINGEQIIPFLQNRSMDVISTPPGILFSAYDNAANLRHFVFGDLFMGFAIMASEDYKSVKDFTSTGMDNESALRMAVQQMKGKTFAYPSEAAIKPFIDLVMEKGGISLNDVNSLVLEDPLTVNAMRKGQADFQVGGVPSRVTLEKEGFKAIVNAGDIAALAKASAESKELSSILQNGWATTEQYYIENKDIILRLASVNYRIMEFINEFPEKAATIHMPFLSKVSGEQFSLKDAEGIYGSLNPFFTFDMQETWFLDKSSPFYFRHLNGSIINSHIDSGVYKNYPPYVDDVIYADDIYLELLQYKKSTTRLLTKLNNDSISEGSNISTLYEEAKKHFDIYNYYDAFQFARRAIDLLSKE